MSNLIKPAEYAKKLGISRQAVYAKIKKGVLTSKSVEGKLYIVQTEADSVTLRSPNAPHAPSGTSPTPAEPTKDFRDLLAAKDETIGILKETVVDLKDTNKMITSTLRGEVELLKEAFSEMKMLYSTRIEHLQTEETLPTEASPAEIETSDFETEELDIDDSDPDEVSLTVEETHDAIEVFDGSDVGDELAWIELEDFFDEHDIRKKTKQAKISKHLKKLFKRGDSRVDSYNGTIIVLADVDFSDLFRKKNKKKR